MNVKGLFANRSPLGKLIVLLFVVLLSTLLFSIMAILILIPFGGLPYAMQAMGMAEYDGQSVLFLKFIQIVQSIGIFIVPAIIVALLISSNGYASYLHLNTKLRLDMLILAILAMFISLPIISQLTIWNSEMAFPDWLNGVESWMRQKEDQAQFITGIFLDTKTTGDLLLNILMIGIIPGIGEELLFRGVIQGIMKEWTKNDHWAIWISAILFSAIHLQFYGFVPRAILGAMFGYLYVWGKSLWLPIIAHFLNNSIAVLVYHFSNIGVMNGDPEKVGTSSLSVTLACLLCTVVLFYVMWRISNKKIEISEK